VCTSSIGLAFASNAAAESVFSNKGLGSMTTERAFAGAATLPNGEVLIVGGQHGNDETILSSAELFNPETDTFSSAGLGSMVHGRELPAVAPLPDGEVLIAGGGQCNLCENKFAELFNPKTGTFSDAGVGFTADFKNGASAAPLPDGEVLIVGGEGSPGNAEKFNPKTDSFTTAGLGLMTQDRKHALAAPLPDGNVVVGGGFEPAEEFYPQTGTFSTSGVGSMAVQRSFGVAASLPDGQVLVAGGVGGAATGELFNPETGTFSSSGLGSLTTDRVGAVAAALPDGKVLIAGGIHEGKYLGSAEVFEPAPQAVTNGGNFGDQTVGEPAAVQSVTVTNVGAQPLEIISGSSLEGPGKAAFVVVSNTCVPGRHLTFEGSCVITVSFSPSNAESYSAHIIASDNAEAPISVALSGTGIPANHGPTGPAGLTGSTGPTGTAGTIGVVGATGAIGSQGPLGKTGATGQEGPAGKVEIVKCALVPAHGKSAKGRKRVYACTTSFVSRPVKLGTGASARASLSRGGHTYAVGTVQRARRVQWVVLSASAAVAPGKYTLTITRASEKSRSTTRRTITIP
jgi:hypothetical protein